VQMCLGNLIGMGLQAGRAGEAQSLIGMRLA
jgi:hypothetical protein